jgi:hypothetical protein
MIVGRKITDTLSSCVLILMFQLGSIGCSTDEQQLSPDQVQPQKQAVALTATLTAKQQRARAASIDAEIDARRSHLTIVAKKQKIKGQLYDWVVPESQVPGGLLPKPPPPLWELQGKTREEFMTPEMQQLVSDEFTLKGPSGTVSLWRPDADYIATQAATLDEFYNSVPKPDPSQCQATGFGTQCRHYEQTTAYAPSNANFWGTAGVLNIWNPTLDASEGNQAMSLMQFNVSRKGADGLLDTLELGWQVQPKLYQGDHQTHLFLFLTGDGYSGNIDHNCYDRACVYYGGGGWHNLSHTKTLGMPIPTSMAGGSQVEALIGVLAAYVNPDNGDTSAAYYWVWWVDEWIGAVATTFYAPTGTFDGLAGGIASADWYGEVVDVQDAAHAMTHTGMGSGRFVGAGPGFAAYIRDMTTSNNGSTWTPFFNNRNAFSGASAACYDKTFSRGSDGFWNHAFALGGPGFNTPNCISDNANP